MSNLGELFQQLARIFRTSEAETEQQFETALELIIDFTGAEAAGIRLREEDSYPFSVSRSYPDEFIERKTDLLVRSQKSPLRKPDDSPIYECWCGAVLAGDLDEKLEAVTEFGSLCTGDLSGLHESAKTAAQPYRLRNTCLDAGYSSLALIPLKYGNTISGLLQLNHSQKNAFSEELITELEEALCPMAAAALAHTNELLIGELKDIFNTTIPLAVIGSDYRLKRVNQSFLDLFSPMDKHVEERYCYDIAPGECCQTENCPLKIVMGKETELAKECEKEVAGGEKRYLLETVTPRYNHQGKQTGVVAAFQDITERKKAKEKLAKTLTEKETLLDKIHQLVENNSRVIAELIELQVRGKEHGFNEKGLQIIESLAELRERLEDY